MTRGPTKQVERIGTKLEDWKELESILEDDKIITRHISSLEQVDPGQKIILKTNLSSEFNPLSKRPKPLTLGSDKGGTEESNRSVAPTYGICRTSPWDDSKDIQPGGDDQLLGRNRVPEMIGDSVQRQGLKVYVEDIVVAEAIPGGNEVNAVKSFGELCKFLFMPIDKEEPDERNDSALSKGDGITFFEKTFDVHKGAHDLLIKKYEVSGGRKRLSLSSPADVAPVCSAKERANDSTSRNSHCEDTSCEVFSSSLRSREDEGWSGCRELTLPSRDLHRSDEPLCPVVSLDGGWRSNESSTSVDVSHNDRCCDVEGKRKSVRSCRRTLQVREAFVSDLPNRGSLSDATQPRSESSLRKSTASSITCPHGHNLAEVPFVEQVYQVRSALQVDRGCSGSHHCSHQRPNKRLPRGSFTCNDSHSSEPVHETTFLTRCLNSEQSTTFQPLCQQTSKLRTLLERTGHTLYDELEESDWSLVSSLVEDICRNKRKKRKRVTPGSN